MRMPIWAILFIFFLGNINVLMAQRANTYHQTFPLSQSTTSAIIDISYPFVIEEWVGDYIMVETNIKMKNITRQTMDYFISQGRYDVLQTDFKGIAKFEMKPMLRKTITTRYGECEEDILLKVYVPKHLNVSTAGRKVLALK